MRWQSSIEEARAPLVVIEGHFEAGSVLAGTGLVCDNIAIGWSRAALRGV